MFFIDRLVLGLAAIALPLSLALGATQPAHSNHDVPTAGELSDADAAKLGADLDNLPGRRPAVLGPATEEPIIIRQARNRPAEAVPAATEIYPATE